MSIRRWCSKSLLLVVVVAFQSCREQKTGFVDVFKLVSEFELQKEYTAQARREFEQARAAIDSVVYVQGAKDPAAAEKLKNALYGELSQKAEAHNKEIEQMLWTRLNPYITDFGKEKGYTYIYGANGTGNVLYAAESEDVTGEVVKYVNKRYHGKN